MHFNAFAASSCCVAPVPYARSCSILPALFALVFSMLLVAVAPFADVILAPACIYTHFQSRRARTYTCRDDRAMEHTALVSEQ